MLVEFDLDNIWSQLGRICSQLSKFDLDFVGFELD